MYGYGRFSTSMRCDQVRLWDVFPRDLSFSRVRGPQKTLPCCPDSDDTPAKVYAYGMQREELDESRRESGPLRCTPMVSEPEI